VDFVGAVCLPIHSKVKHALRVLGDLCGDPDLTDGEVNTEVAVLNFVVAEHIARRSPLQSGCTPFFLQAVAANLFFKNDTSFRSDPRGFYAYVTVSAREADQVFREVRGRDRILFAVKQLLALCSLEGPENHDLVVAVHQQLAPDLCRGEQLMQRHGGRRASAGSGADAFAAAGAGNAERQPATRRVSVLPRIP
jgi:hypothetical protein